MGKEGTSSMSSANSRAKAAKPAGRLYFLDLAAGRVLTSNPDGSDVKTIVNEGRKLPDGIVVDVAAGHIYWTNMGNPKANDGTIDRAVVGLGISHICPVNVAGCDVHHDTVGKFSALVHYGFHVGAVGVRRKDAARSQIQKVQTTHSLCSGLCGLCS